MNWKIKKDWFLLTYAIEDYEKAFALKFPACLIAVYFLPNIMQLTYAMHLQCSEYLSFRFPRCVILVAIEIFSRSFLKICSNFPVILGHKQFNKSACGF